MKFITGLGRWERRKNTQQRVSHSPVIQNSASQSLIVLWKSSPLWFCRNNTPFVLCCFQTSFYKLLSSTRCFSVTSLPASHLLGWFYVHLFYCLSQQNALNCDSAEKHNCPAASRLSGGHLSSKNQRNAKMARATCLLCEPCCQHEGWMHVAQRETALFAALMSEPQRLEKTLWSLHRSVPDRNLRNFRVHLRTGMSWVISAISFILSFCLTEVGKTAWSRIFVCWTDENRKFPIYWKLWKYLLRKKNDKLL